MKNLGEMIGFVSLAVLGVCLLFGPVSFAEEKSGQFDNSRIKCIASHSFHNDVMNFVPTIPGDGDRIGLILTKGGVYELRKDLSKTFIMEGINKSRDGSEDYIISASLSGEFAFQYVFESEVGILDLKAKIIKELKLCGEPIISESSIFIANGMTRKSEIIDFKGNIINELSGRDSGLLPKAHKTGFIANGRDLIFYDKNGNIINKTQGDPNGNFDVSYDTGATVTVSAAKNQGKSASGGLVSFYGKNGDHLNHLSIPCNGPSGVAISRDGNHSVVSCISNNEVLYLDVNSGKLLWKKTVKLGDYFSNWTHPIPLSSDGKFFAIYSKIDAIDTDFPLFIVLDSEGEILGYIEPKTRMVFDHKIVFDPNHPRIFYCHDKKMDIYAILENSRGSK
jgi:hypothetical protein